MNQYLASVVDEPAGTNRTGGPRECHYLITAPDHDGAYAAACQLSARTPSDRRFLGVSDLLMTYEGIGDGVELAWARMELPAGTAKDLVRSSGATRAAREGPSSVGWYAAQVVLCEKHDEGSHGGTEPCWINTYALSAPTVRSAYEKALSIGGANADPSISQHHCDGDKAHWELVGVEELIPLLEPPAPGALLSCDDLPEPNDVRIPNKEERRRGSPASGAHPALTVFVWESERRSQSREPS